MSDNSTNKLAIEIIDKGHGVQWIDVLLLKYGPPHPRFRPSFRDLHRIIRAIGDCEEIKYPPPGSGRFKFAEFLYEAGFHADFNELARKYNIPERAGDQIVSTNGARVRVTAPALPLLTADDIKWK